MLFHEGDRSDWVAVLLEGQVKASYFTRDGKEVVLAVHGAGALIGELSAIDGDPRSATVTAIEPTEALLLGVEEFTDFLQRHPKASLLLLRMLTHRLRDSDRKRIEFTAHDSVGRVAGRLVELADRFGEASEGGLRIRLALSQEELAGWTGSSREAASKALSALRARGWIETHRRGITVLDLEALRRRAT